MRTYESRQKFKKLIDIAIGDELFKTSSAELGRIILWAMKSCDCSRITLCGFLHLVTEEKDFLNDGSEKLRAFTEGWHSLVSAGHLVPSHKWHGERNEHFISRDGDLIFDNIKSKYDSLLKNN